ncbi:hypothetical protein ScPMuIL_003315 [Solemya velum]
MHFHPEGRHVNSPLPTRDNFRDICRGPMKDVWKFVINHVHSAQTVKKVQGNLALKRQTNSRNYTVKYKDEAKYDDQRSILLKKRGGLSSEITSVLSDIGHLENDLRRTQEELMSTETEYQLTQSTLNDLRRKTSLLEVYSHQCQEKNREYAEYTSRISGKVDAVLNRAKKSSECDVFYSKERSSVECDDEEPHSPFLETACSKHGSFGNDKEAFRDKKEQLWGQVERVLGDFSVQQVVRALITNTHSTTMDLRDARNRIDIRRDAEKLRFKYEKGQLKDVSLPPSLMQGVHQLVEEGNLAYIDRFVETEKYKNETFRTEKQFNEVRAQIDTKLKTMFRKSADLQLARSVIDTDLALVADRSTLHCLSEEAYRLRDKISRDMKAKEVLYTKHQKITDFQEIADRKQNLIRVLVKQNANAHQD